MLICLLLTSSCNSKNTDYSGKIYPHITGAKDSFVYVVNEDFLEKNKKSPASKSHPKLTESELWLLKKILKKNSYCLDKNNKPSFEIDSKQEKVYDVTYSNLISSNLKVKPIIPTSYYGKCLN